MTEFVYGIHSVLSLLETSPAQIKKLVLLASDKNPKLRQVTQLANDHHIPYEFLARPQLDRLLPANANHQGVVAYHEAPAERYTEYDIETLLQKTTTPPLILILDGLQDPHNLGACLRSADAAGAHMVIAPKDRAVGLTPSVRKVACGAAETVPFIQVTNLVRTIETLKSLNIWVYGTAAEATQSVFDTNLTGPAAWVLGAEEKGIRRLTREHCDLLVSLPMHGAVSSLNVSVTTGICLFETVRQRRIK